MYLQNDIRDPRQIQVAESWLSFRFLLGILIPSFSTFPIHPSLRLVRRFLKAMFKIDADEAIIITLNSSIVFSLLLQCNPFQFHVCQNANFLSNNDRLMETISSQHVRECVVILFVSVQPSEEIFENKKIVTFFFGENE